HVSTFYVPAISAFSVITACYTTIAIGLTFARDSGALKRIHGSPLPVWAYMFARITHAVLIAILLVAICAAFGAIFYNATLPTAFSAWPHEALRTWARHSGSSPESRASRHAECLQRDHRR